VEVVRHHRIRGDLAGEHRGQESQPRLQPVFAMLDTCPYLYLFPAICGVAPYLESSACPEKTEAQLGARLLLRY